MKSNTNRPIFSYQFKKFLALFLLMFMLIVPGKITLASTIQIFINEELLLTDVEPQLISGRTYLPLRACAEALNATLDYDSASKKITIMHEGTEINLTVGQTTASINGQEYTIDAKPFLMNDFTLVPVRFISEALHCLVEGEPQTLSVFIYTDSDTPIHAGQFTPSPDESIPQVENIAIEALQQINNVRQQKKLETFITLGELVSIAEEHSKDMAENAYFATNSPSQGSPAKRAQAFNLQGPSEIIAKVNYDLSNVSSAVNAWLNDPTTNAILLNTSASYIGVSAYRVPGSNEVYLTAEVLPTRAYFIDTPQHLTTSEAKLTFNGRSTARQEVITIYKLSNSSQSMYSAKKSQTVTVNNTYFFSDIELWEPGSYVINIANCNIYVTYK